MLPLAASVGPSACRQAAPAAAEVVDDDGAEVIELVDDKPGEHGLWCWLDMLHCGSPDHWSDLSDRASMLPSNHGRH